MATRLPFVEPGTSITAKRWNEHVHVTNQLGELLRAPTDLDSGAEKSDEQNTAGERLKETARESVEVSATLLDSEGNAIGTVTLTQPESITFSSNRRGSITMQLDTGAS